MKPVVALLALLLGGCALLPPPPPKLDEAFWRSFIADEDRLEKKRHDP